MIRDKIGELRTKCVKQTGLRCFCDDHTESMVKTPF